MNLSAVLRELMLAGLEGDALLAAVERIEASAGKSTNAARQQRYRDRQRDAREGVEQPETVTRNVTCVTNVTENTPPAFPLDGPPKSKSNPPLIPQSTPPKSNSTSAKAGRGTRLAADFAMPADWLAWAVADRGWQQFDATEEAAAFTDFWHAKAGANGCKLDWQATWRNWCRNSRRQTNDQRNNTVGRNNGQASRGSIIRDLVAQARADEAESVGESLGNHRGTWAEIPRRACR